MSTAPSLGAPSTDVVSPTLSLNPTSEYGKAPKMFSCTICSTVIKGRRSNLTRHMIDLHSNAKKTECGLCGTFFKQTMLAKHAKECQGLASAPLLPPTPIPSAPEPTLASPSSAPTATTATPTDSLTMDAIDAASADFLAWLREPVLPTEHMIRKIATPQALAQLRQGLRQVIREVAREVPDLFAAGVQLRLLVVPDVVAALIGAMQRRGVRAATIYAPALLLKKVCVWLCSRQSRATKTYIAPDTLPGWGLICHHCSSTTKERKKDNLARRLRGTDDDKWMNSDEKNKLLSACLARLHGIQQQHDTVGIFDSTAFTDHLIVALLLLGLAPRPQTFRELTTEMVRPPGSDSRTPEQFVIDGEHGKTNMSYYCAVHPVLTGSLRFYLERVLGAGYRGPLFLQMGGIARQDFSLTTCALTKLYVGRPITASKFRMTVATDLLSKPSVKGKSLAALMGHTEAVQQQWYVGARMAEDARACQDALLQGVVVPAGMLSGDNHGVHLQQTQNGAAAATAPLAGSCGSSIASRHQL